ncbi:MAG: PAAR-like domain-containing protein [Candidatus Thiodiazotropha sp.]
MANDVYANGRELSCKKADGKSICSFPDVCFTPPQTPATPPGVPIPYPNTGMAKDTTKGSKKVKISGKEIILKNKSHFKQSYGDEAGCAPKKGVITSKNRGKVYFNAWSMDVKFEGKNVVRHFDLTTHNHGSVPGNTVTWPYLDTMAMSNPDHPCVEDQMKEMEACKDYKPYGEEDACDGIDMPPTPPACPDGMSKKDFKKSQPYKDYKSLRHAFYAEAAHDSAKHDCLNARRCQLVPYKPTGNQPGCCDSKRQTGHHLVEAAACFDTGRGGSGSDAFVDCGTYDQGKAPSICAEGTDHGTGTHGLMHTFQSDSAIGCDGGEVSCTSGKKVQVDHKTNYKDARDSGVDAVAEVFPEANCSGDCLKAQMDAYHKDECKMKDTTELKAVATTTSPDVEAGRAYVSRNKA